MRVTFAHFILIILIGCACVHIYYKYKCACMGASTSVYNCLKNIATIKQVEEPSINQFSNKWKLLCSKALCSIASVGTQVMLVFDNYWTADDRPSLTWHDSTTRKCGSRCSRTRMVLFVTCTQQQSIKHYRTNLLRPSASNSKQRVIIASTTHTDDVSNQPHAISVANLRLHTFTSFPQPLLSALPAAPVPSCCSSRLRFSADRSPSRELGMCVHRGTNTHVSGSGFGARICPLNNHRHHYSLHQHRHPHLSTTLTPLLPSAGKGNPVCVYTVAVEHSQGRDWIGGHRKNRAAEASGVV
jgi:hypothetical protein